MATFLNTLRRLPPVAALIHTAEARPRFTAWIALSLGICLVLAISGWDARVPLGPWLVLFAVGILAAGLCIKIVTGDDGSDEGST